MLSNELGEAMKPPTRLINVHRDPETGEVHHEMKSLKKALLLSVSDDAEIIQNGVTLATVRGRRWELTKAGKKLLAMEKRGEEILRVSVGWERR